ncbi:hypothetical protein WAI453_004770 [Rhynchosporium graminicola]|uniref:Uncharacterized protein n=1 Tax=Rhynchosporium graminicola TaxID=2792576 RepID=A0A1E1LGD7_9HELO|nr:uncharacterized protein RCO7_03668 [Rhynchosporium commune]
MSFLRLASALKNITQKSSHPSDLIYNIQLARAKQQQLNRKELSDGKVGVVELAGPQELNDNHQAVQSQVIRNEVEAQGNRNKERLEEKPGTGDIGTRPS